MIKYNKQIDEINSILISKWKNRFNIKEQLQRIIFDFVKNYPSEGYPESLYHLLCKELDINYPSDKKDIEELKTSFWYIFSQFDIPVHIITKPLCSQEEPTYNESKSIGE